MSLSSSPIAQNIIKNSPENLLKKGKEKIFEGAEKAVDSLPFSPKLDMQLFTLQSETLQMMKKIKSSLNTLKGEKREVALGLLSQLKGLVESPQEAQKNIQSAVSEDEILNAKSAEAGAEYKKSMMTRVFDTMKNMFSSVGGFIKENLVSLLLVGVPKLFSWAMKHPRLLMMIISSAVLISSGALTAPVALFMANKDEMLSQIQALWEIFQSGGMPAITEKITNMAVDAGMDHVVAPVLLEHGIVDNMGNGELTPAMIEAWEKANPG